MILNWAWHNCSIGNAFLITLAMLIFQVVIVTIAVYILCERKTAVRVFLFRLSATLVAMAEDLDFLTDHDDDPIMPAEYVSWASAQKWRESCVRPGERRM